MQHESFNNDQTHTHVFSSSSNLRNLKLLKSFKNDQAHTHVVSSSSPLKESQPTEIL
jgi:hypothetical protein